jgi:hypothetical protein
MFENGYVRVLTMCEQMTTFPAAAAAAAAATIATIATVIIIALILLLLSHATSRTTAAARRAVRHYSMPNRGLNTATNFSAVSRIH